MRALTLLLAAALAPAQLCFATLVLNSPVVDASLFRLTTFANTGGLAYSMQRLGDGSIAVLSGSTILRYTDANNDGVADGPGAAIYNLSGSFLTGFIQIGNLFAVGDRNSGAILLLQPGATPADNLTLGGSLDFGYPADWYHPTAGLAARPTPGSPGSFDLVFNVGAQFNDQVSTDPVTLSGLLNGSVDGDSLYKITLDLTGGTPVASGLVKVASGIRNVAGMQFDAGGNLIFAANAIDGPGADGDEPPQADELNRIAAAQFGVTIPNFGYPGCYVAYRTGAQVGSGCESPLAVFQPIDSGTPQESQNEGPVELAFSPSGFPSAFANGVFIGFAGKGAIGAANEENAVVYYDFGTGSYLQFVAPGLPGVGRPIGLLSADGSLFISDFFTGQIYQITPNDADVPEPAAFLLMSAGLAGLAALRRPAAKR